MALGIGADAQYNATATFDDTSILGQFGNGTTVTTATGYCSAPVGGQIGFNATYPQSGWMIEPGNLGQVSNGQAITVSFNYKKAAGLTGTLYVAYMIYDDVSDSWDIVTIDAGTNITTAAVNTCTAKSAIIPAGTLDPSKEYGFGYWFIRNTGNANFYVDDISVTQSTPTVAPNCTTFTAPSNGSTISYGATDLTWNAAALASSYKITIGTGSGQADVLNTTAYGTTTSFFTSPNQTYYAKIVPTNQLGDATGCQEITFTTNNNIAYCAAVPGNFGFNDGITKVVLNGETVNISNSSTSNAGTEYTDYTSSVPAADLKKGSSYPLSVYVDTDGNYTQYQSAWFDWNHDGNFDSTEYYDLGTATNVANGISSLCPLSVTVPVNAATGTTRMRTRTYYNSSNETNPCMSGDDGEVEDYVINILAVAPACATISAPIAGATNVNYGTTTISWASVTGATGYKVYVGTAPDSYEIENGTTTTATSFDVSTAADTTYYVKIVAYNDDGGDAVGCQEISFKTESLGVSDIQKAGISVFPNPFHDVLKISDIKGVKSISVSDMSGRQITTLAPAAELNLSNLKDGLYIISLNMEDGSVKTVKAIKK